MLVQYTHAGMHEQTDGQAKNIILSLPVMNKLHFNFKWSLLLQNSKYTTDIMLLCSVGCSLQTGCAPVANQQRQSTKENNVRAAAQKPCMTIKELTPTTEFTPSDPSIDS